MYQIIDGPGTGKTSRLLLLAKETGATIVCSNPRDMKEKAYAYGLTGINCTTYEDFFDHIYFKGEMPRYLIDDIERMFKEMPGATVLGYAVSTDN